MERDLITKAQLRFLLSLINSIYFKGYKPRGINANGTIINIKTMHDGEMTKREAMTLITYLIECRDNGVQPMACTHDKKEIKKIKTMTPVKTYEDDGVVLVNEFEYVERGEVLGMEERKWQTQEN